MGHGNTYFTLLFCEYHFVCCCTVCWQHRTVMRERMLMWFVATSTWVHCTTTDACQPLAEACQDRQFLCSNPTLPHPNPSLGSWCGACEGPPSGLHGLWSRIGLLIISRMANDFGAQHQDWRALFLVRYAQRA